MLNKDIVKENGMKKNKKTINNKLLVILIPVCFIFIFATNSFCEEFKKFLVVLEKGTDVAVLTNDIKNANRTKDIDSVATEFNSYENLNNESLIFGTLRTDSGISVEELSEISGVISAEEDFVLYRIKDDVTPYTKNMSETKLKEQLVSQKNNSLNPNDPLFGQQKNLTASGFPEAWEYSEGSKKIKIALIDDGVNENHSDLKANIYDVEKIGNSTGKGEYGSHPASVIAALGNNNEGTAGINWNSSLIILNAVNADGSVSASILIEALNSISKRMDNGENIKVVYVPLSSWVKNKPSTSGAFYSAFVSIAKKGATFVFPSGDDNQDLRNPGGGGTNPNKPDEIYTGKTMVPGGMNVPGALVVSSVSEKGELSAYSNKAPEDVVLSAYGEDVLGIYGEGYFYFSGSSSASAMVAGTMGLLFDKFEKNSAESTRRILVSSADKKAELANKTSSEGIMNALKALSTQGGEPVSGVRLNKTYVETKQGASMILEAFVLPDTAANKNVVWGSTNTKILSVNNGTVTAIGPGEASIEVTTEEGEFTAVCDFLIIENETNPEDPTEEATGCRSFGISPLFLIATVPLFFIKKIKI